jgi:predicted regulator of Ras-like GTPase activity (Roadblock/LC7/MglB family)
MARSQRLEDQLEAIEINVKTLRTYFTDNDDRGVLLTIDEIKDQLDEIRDEIESN